MDNAVGPWIVTAVVLADAALMLLLVKHWTGATIAEILFRWDPREPRPNSSRARVQTAQADLAELAELNRTSDVLNKVIIANNEVFDKTVIADLEQTSEDFEKSAEMSGLARKMFDEGGRAAGSESRSESRKDLRIGVAANNRFNSAHSKNLKPRGTLADTIQRSSISRPVNRQSDQQRVRGWAARDTHNERRYR
jgi:hypothetical protein